MKSIICLLVLALCATALAESIQGKWVLQTQTQFKHSGPDSYQFCVPVGARVKTDKSFISMQVVFEETFRYMTVDFDFNGQGVDHVENQETNIVTFMLNDYQGNAFSNWNNIAIANGTLTGTIKSDKKPLKIIFSVAVNKPTELETVPRAHEKCERFYVAQEVTVTITVETTGAVARLHTGIVFFIFSAFGSFFLTLSCCLCCFLIVRRRACKKACRARAAQFSDEEMQGMYPGEVSQIQQQQEMRKEEPAPVQQVPQPIFYIAPQVQDNQQYFMPPSQFYPMMQQPQYIQFMPAPQQ
jgi:hypothetical protein